MPSPPWLSPEQQPYRPDREEHEASTSFPPLGGLLKTGNRGRTGCDRHHDCGSENGTSAQVTPPRLWPDSEDRPSGRGDNLRHGDSPEQSTLDVRTVLDSDGWYVTEVADRVSPHDRASS